MKMGVISCGGSNVTSVVNALGKVGYAPELMMVPDRKVDFLIMPGVGTYGTGTRRLNDTGFSEYIKAHVREGKPVIGICLGMQMLFESSEEDPTAAGLAILPGHFHKLQEQSSPDLRSPPNIGYNFVEFQVPNNGGSAKQLFSSLNGYFYFLHSYALKQMPTAMDALGISTFNTETIIPFVLRENLCGMQFHPERSGLLGLQLLSRTIDALK